MKRILLTFSISFLIFPFTGAAQGEHRYASGTATDQEGNTFEWINYGTQDWAIENAEVVTYRDGTKIPQVTDNTEWANLTTGAWCYYDNDPTKGKLYNWYAVAGIHDNDPNTPNKTFAPEGWHVPTKAEWATLENYLITNGYNHDGTIVGNKISKAMASTTGWDSDATTGVPGNNQSTNNSSGFNAFPIGTRYAGGANFSNENNLVVFWSVTPSYDVYSWFFTFSKADFGASIYGGNLKTQGMTVRFLRDASDNGAFDIILKGTISAENNQIKNVADPTEAQDVTTKSYVENIVSNTYTQAEVNNIISETIAELQDQIDVLQAATGSGTVSDQDGNSYPYLTYGEQVWTVKNAEMITYGDGTEIPQVTDATEWSNLTTGAWCYYDNDPSKGKLYNWYAVMGIHDTDPNTPNKEFAPEGWHVPTDAEWTTLEGYLIANGYNYDQSTTENKIAKAMASTTGWNSSAVTGAIGNDQSLNNSSGFNGLPVGYRYLDGSLAAEGKWAFFWSFTEINTFYAWSRGLDYDESSLSYLVSYGNKQNGFSVRFVRN